MEDRVQNNKEHDIRIKNPVESSNIITAKKSTFSKVVDMFIPEDIDDMKTFILKERVVPGIKTFIWDMCNAVLSSILGRDGAYYPGNNYSTFRNGASYTDFYKNKHIQSAGIVQRAQRPSYYVYDYEDIIFPDQFKASKALNELRMVEAEYRTVRVADYYQAASLTAKSTDFDYGWSVDLGNDLRNAGVYPLQGGYTIKLPKALPLK